MTTKNHLTGAKAMTYWMGRKTHKEKGKTVVEADEDEPALLPSLKKEAAEDMYNAACNLVHQAHTMRSGEEPDKESVALAEKWFGKKVKQKDVTKQLKKLVDGLTGSSLHVRFSRDKQVLGAYDPDFKVPDVVQLGKPILFRRYTWGEKVMTFLHEMSHVLLDTVDKGLDGDGKPKTAFTSLGAAYGPFALQIAQEKSPGGLGWGEALGNAENWGYFLVSHWTHILEKNRAEWLGVTGGDASGENHGEDFTHRTFGRLNDATLKNVDTYKKGRPDMPGPEGNTGDVGESYTNKDVKLYDTTIVARPVEFTKEVSEIKEKPKLVCEKCKKEFVSKIQLQNHECKE